VAGGVFTDDLVQGWIEWKRENELAEMALRPHPYEFHLYYDSYAPPRRGAVGVESVVSLLRGQGGAPLGAPPGFPERPMAECSVPVHGQRGVS